MRNFRRNNHFTCEGGRREGTFSKFLAMLLQTKGNAERPCFDLGLETSRILCVRPRVSICLDMNTTHLMAYVSLDTCAVVAQGVSDRRISYNICHNMCIHNTWLWYVMHAHVRVGLHSARDSHLPLTLTFPRGLVPRTYPLVSTEGKKGGLAQICRKPLSRKVSQLYIIDTKNRFVGRSSMGRTHFATEERTFLTLDRETSEPVRSCKIYRA